MDSMIQLCSSKLITDLTLLGSFEGTPIWMLANGVQWVLAYQERQGSRINCVWAFNTVNKLSKKS